MFSVERTGYITLGSLVLDVVNDLRNNGFDVKYPLTSGTYTPPTGTNFTITLETTSAVNQFHSTDPWRVSFKLYDHIKVSTTETMSEPQMLAVFSGTGNQLKDDGSIVAPMKKRDITSGLPYYGTPNGCMGLKWTGSINPANTTQADDDIKPGSAAESGEGFFSTYHMGSLAAQAFNPLSYFLSVTSRGIFLGIWSAMSFNSGTEFSWFVIQRSVNKDTGAVLGSTPATVSSRRPVFCVNSTVNRYFKFITRESDILASGPGIEVTDDAEDNPAVLNPNKQVSFNEAGNYVITFLNNLSTTRFKYPDELDMVGTISSDVIGDSQEIDITVYGETLPRTYRALQANSPNNTGMRILVLKANPNA